MMEDCSSGAGGTFKTETGGHCGIGAGGGCWRGTVAEKKRVDLGRSIVCKGECAKEVESVGW